MITLSSSAYISCAHVIIVTSQQLVVATTIDANLNRAWIAVIRTRYSFTGEPYNKISQQADEIERK